MCRHFSLFSTTGRICALRLQPKCSRRLFCSISPSTSSGAHLEGSRKCQKKPLCALSAFSREELGTSILHPEANGSTQRIVLISKVCSLGSSAFGLVMVPLVTSALWEPIAERPAIAVFAGVANVFLLLFAFTPILLHLLTKRFVQNVFFNEREQVFTTVHYNFFLQKRALRFTADQLDRRFWLPLATCLAHSYPMLLPLDANCYSDQTAFKLLTKNIKLPTEEEGKREGMDEDDRR
ncbi:hypothetical protein niasHT_035431 [Heterodera trifolii]|uniref:Transmembrane protein 70 n=1 Tax=Heterodera trifolii TaxID=157864 RepID=A0ABD2I7I2_9BILA